MFEFHHAKKVAILLIFAVLGCSQPDDQTDLPHDPSSQQVRDAPEEPIPYPRGRWRLVAPKILANSILWVSHILIRHSRSDVHVPGSVAPWRLEMPPKNRSRAAALQLANEVAVEVAKQPQNFAQLARRYSEDSTSRSLGGSLGGARASDFMLEPPVLDALSALKPGEISRVVETAHGFQIFYRRPPPLAEWVHGAHLVIAHEDALWSTALGLAPSKRTRAEALSLATQIYHEALANPQAFQELVQTHSEHPDIAARGDLGTWSTLEPTPYPRAVEALQGLAVGALAPPIESYYGFEILQRMPDLPAKLYAMEAIKLAFDPRRSESRQVALDLATKLANLVARDPARFDELRQQYCCSEPEIWSAGRDEPGLTDAVDQLSFEQISPSPVQQYLNIVIPKRIDPMALPLPPKPSLELPSPERPDLDWLRIRISPWLWEQEFLNVARKVDGQLALSADQQRGLGQLAQRLGAANGEVIFPAELTSTLEASLGPERAGQFIKMLETSLEDLVLNGGGNVHNPRQVQ